VVLNDHGENIGIGFYRFEDFGAYGGMSLIFAYSSISELIRLVKDSQRNADLADVVQQSSSE